MAGRMVDGEVIQEDCRIPLRDGVELQGVLYRSAGMDLSCSRGYPAVVSLGLRRTRFQDGLFGGYCRRGGLVALSVFFRGREGSGGVFSLDRVFLSDLEDVFGWLEGRGWYSGCSGYLGHGLGAYAGIQFRQVCEKHIRCLVLSSFPVVVGCSELYCNGVFRLDNLRWLVAAAADSPGARSRPEVAGPLQDMLEDLSRYARYWPFARGATPLRLLPEYEELALRLAALPSLESACLRDRPLTPAEFFADFLPAPMLLFSHWGDCFLPSALRCYFELSLRQSSGLQCIVGPGRPEAPPEGAAPDPRGGDFAGYTLGWFRHHLCQDRQERFLKRAIHFLPLRPGAPRPEGRSRTRPPWRTAVFWPPGEREVVFYLQEDSLLSSQRPKTEDDRSASVFFADPARPMPADAGLKAFPARLEDCLPFLRGDLVSFVSPPLKRELAIAGSARVCLYLACSAPDGELYCRLASRRPGDPGDPQVEPLCDSIQRITRNRANLVPSKEVPSFCRLREIALGPVAAVLPAGSCLQLDISGGCFPRFAPGGPAGIPPGLKGAGQIACYRVYHSRRCPSCIALPLLPSSENG